MKRLLLNLLAVLSLVLCTALTITWISSYASPHAVEWGDARLAVGKAIVLDRGSFMFAMASNVRPIVLKTTSDGDLESVGQVQRSCAT